MTTKKCKFHPYIDDYILGVRSGEIVVGKDIPPAMDQVERTLSQWDVHIDHEKINKAVELIEKYFKIELFDWELFIIALIHCTYKTSNTLVFDEIALFMGRGNGKNGFISCLCWYLTTHYHGIEGYNIDIVANSEDQAKTSFKDVHAVLEKWKGKLSKFFKWNLTTITNKKTNSTIEYNASNAKTKDSKRPGCIVFDEVHVYENYDQMNVHESGLGKVPHARVFKISTFGHVREGVMDEEIKTGEEILSDDTYVDSSLYLIYRVDSEEDVMDPVCWHKANPSLKYLPVLMAEIQKAFKKMKRQPSKKADFYTKRMNIPKGDAEVEVADRKYIKATNKPVPDMIGHSAVAGIDYAKTNDMVSVNIHFKEGDQRYDITHSWLCLASADLSRLKIPWKQWAEEGKLTLVDDVDIKPKLITDYLVEMKKLYRIECIGIDNFRYRLMAEALKLIGYEAKGDLKNVKLVQPSDIMKIIPVIDTCFENERLIWGDEPLLRWGTNNTKKVRQGKKNGTDTGNYYYAKIEAKSRKTDPFMAFVAAMVVEDKIIEGCHKPLPDLDVLVF